MINRKYIFVGIFLGILVFGFFGLKNLLSPKNLKVYKNVAWGEIKSTPNKDGKISLFNGRGFVGLNPGSADTTKKIPDQLFPSNIHSITWSRSRDCAIFELSEASSGGILQNANRQNTKWWFYNISDGTSLAIIGSYSSLYPLEDCTAALYTEPDISKLGDDIGIDSFLEGGGKLGTVIGKVDFSSLNKQPFQSFDGTAIKIRGTEKDFSLLADEEDNEDVRLFTYSNNSLAEKAKFSSKDRLILSDSGKYLAVVKGPKNTELEDWYSGSEVSVTETSSSKVVYKNTSFDRRTLVGWNYDESKMIVYAHKSGKGDISGWTIEAKDFSNNDKLVYKVESVGFSAESVYLADDQVIVSGLGSLNILSTKDINLPSSRIDNQYLKDKNSLDFISVGDGVKITLVAQDLLDNQQLGPETIKALSGVVPNYDLLGTRVFALFL